MTMFIFLTFLVSSVYYIVASNVSFYLETYKSFVCYEVLYSIFSSFVFRMFLPNPNLNTL